MSVEEPFDAGKFALLTNWSMLSLASPSNRLDGLRGLNRINASLT